MNLLRFQEAAEHVSSRNIAESLLLLLLPKYHYPGNIERCFQVMKTTFSKSRYCENISVKMFKVFQEAIYIFILISDKLAP
jgi:hypothetical protein